MRPNDIVHLHLHTEYSLLRGACRINKLFDKVAQNGQDAVAITDHGVMYGVIDFYKEAKKRGIKPIIGCEVYVASRSRFDKDAAFDGRNYHLILLCKNEIGYQNLIYLVSMAGIDGFYKKPRIDHELLAAHSEGLIALSACISGEIPAKTLAGDEEGALKDLRFYKQTFGDDFYIEIQNHGIDEQLQVNPRLIYLAKQNGIKLVATNDCHYIAKEDAKMQQVLTCIAMNKTVLDDDKLEFQTDEFYLKSTEEMAELFSYEPSSITNTKEIADKCNLEFEFGVTKLPDFKSPNGDNFTYFQQMCYEGLFNRYGSKCSDPQLVERLQYEIDTISKMGFVDYFLIVQDFIAYAKNNGIPVGPGRGSGAGSLAAYCIGITDIDPIGNGLLFERFLNPERVSMPDFDVDFCYERRQEVIDYVTRKYGEDHVCQIITFGTLAARAAVRDVARALGKSYATGDTVAKAIPRELHITIEKSLERSAELKELYNTSEEAREILDMAKQVEGMPRHASTHAAGVVISRLPVYKYVPLQENDGQLITQFPMTTLEELGLLKMDFLGLRTVTVIDDAQRQIAKTVPGFDVKNISYSNKAVFDMLSAGDTMGVFQFESEGMRRVLADLKPEKLEDLTAVLSLYRPGPMEHIPTYIANRKNPARIRYQHPLLQEILGETYGVIVYQEQVMQICRKLAGFTYGQADIVRRAMSKKKMDVMQKERQHFLHGDDDPQSGCIGAVKNGVPAEVANDIFDQMISFASYAFNKSHAACYAYVAYQTAYLKCHYPKQYYAALLTSVVESTPKLAEYMAECIKNNIPILPPSINESSERFTASENGILFSLAGIKGLGMGVIEQILKERETGGPFASLYDFVERMKNACGRMIGKKTVEAMVACGCFDKLHPNRQQAFISIESIFTTVDYVSRKNVAGQTSFFDIEEEEEERFTMLPSDDFTLKQKIAYEHDILGIYMSGHPIDEYKELSGQFTPISKYLYADESMDNKNVELLGVISGIKVKYTKNGTQMLTAAVEDHSGSIEVLAFNNAITDNKALLQDMNVLKISGRLSIKEDETPKIVAFKFLPPAPPERAKSATVYISVQSAGKETMARLQQLAHKYPGHSETVLFEQPTRRYLKCRNIGILPSGPCINALKQVFGEENVVVKS